MRIAFLVDAFPVISETFILNQITGMIDLGHDVTILAAARPDDRETHDDIRKYDLLKLTLYHNDQFGSKLSRVFLFIFLFIIFSYKNPKAFLNSINVFKYRGNAASLTYFYKVFLFSLLGEFDIIQCHFGPNGNLAADLKEMGIKGKIVTMFHGYDIRRGIDKGGTIYQKLFKLGDCILCISDYNYKHLIEFGADPARIVRHPVGIDLKKYKIRSEQARSASAPIKILTVSRLIKEKGLSFGLQAIAKLIHEKKITNIEYQIVGAGPLKGELEKLVDSLGIKRHVQFFGARQQTEVIFLLEQADLFFLPSIAESLPVVLMEAQAAGVPVVATNVGSVDQIVMNGKSGYIVESKNVEAMASALEQLINNKERWIEMGREGRKVVEAKFDCNVLNKKLESIYKELLRT